MERGCDIIMQSGVPLPLLIGVEAHDRLLDRINKHCGKPVTFVGDWCRGRPQRQLAFRRIALANKWSEPMESRAGRILRARGVEIAGSLRGLTPAQFRDFDRRQHGASAVELGRAALTRFPDATGSTLGEGPGWSEPVCQA